MIRQLDVTDQSESRDADLAALRTRLRRGTRSGRAAAQQELEELRVGDLIRLMTIEQGQRRHRRVGLIVGILVYVSVMLGVALVTHRFMMLTYIGSFSGVVAAAVAFSPAHKNAARLLAKYDDIAGAGPLVEALEIPDKGVRTAVRAGLTGILPRLRASDAPRITPDQRKILRAQLTIRPLSKHDPETRPFVVATLTALEQVGDETFLEPVERLAAGTGLGLYDDVRIAAESCVPALRQRIENIRHSSDLLRAASSDHGAPADELLRAAASSGYADPSMLLRSTDSGQIDA